MHLVLVRHGESVWNKEARFTGWTDVELNETGIEEAKKAGKTIKDLNIKFDIAYTSYLKRAGDTLKYIKEEIGDVNTIESYKLNERHYGDLQGKTHKEMEDIVGKEQVHTWRRSYDVRPPELDIKDPRFPGNDPKYKGILIYELPLSESLKDTERRVSSYYHEEIESKLKKGMNVLVVSSGNSLRAFIKHLENISDEDIMKVEIKTGDIISYELDQHLKIIKKSNFSSKI